MRVTRRATGLADIARHDTGCRLTGCRLRRETTLEVSVNDAAGNMPMFLPDGMHPMDPVAMFAALMGRAWQIPLATSYGAI